MNSNLFKPGQFLLGFALVLLVGGTARTSGRAWGDSPLSFDASLGVDFNRTARHLAGADWAIGTFNASLNLSAGLFSLAFLEAELPHTTETRDQTVATIVRGRERTMSFSQTYSGPGDPALGVKLQFLDELRGPFSLYGKASYKFPVADSLKLLGNGRPEVWLEGDLEKQIGRLELEANAFYSLVKNKDQSPFRNYGQTKIGGTFYPVEPLGLGLSFSHFSPQEGYDTLRAAVLDTIPYNLASLSLSFMPVQFLALSATFDQSLTARVPSALTLGLSLEFSWPGEEKGPDFSFADQAVTTAHLPAKDSLPERTMLHLDAELSSPKPVHGVRVNASSKTGELYVLVQDTLKPNDFHAEVLFVPRLPQSYTFAVLDSSGKKVDTASDTATRILPLPKRLDCDRKPAPTLSWSPVPDATLYDLSVSDERDRTVFQTREAVKDTQLTLPVKLRTADYAATLTALDGHGNSSEMTATISVVDTSDEEYKRPALTGAGVTTEHLAKDENRPEHVLLDLEATVKSSLGLDRVQHIQAATPDGKVVYLLPDPARAGHFTLETEAPSPLPPYLVFAARDRDGRVSLPDTEKVGRVLPLPNVQVSREPLALTWTPVEGATSVEVSLADSRDRLLATKAFSNPYAAYFAPETRLKKGAYRFTLTATDPDGNSSETTIPFNVR